MTEITSAMDTDVYDNQPRNPSHQGKDVAGFGSPPQSKATSQSLDDVAVHRDIPDTMELYATNNPFQKKGPKGFIQVKVLEDGNLYVCVDLPGVPDDASCHRVDTVGQKVFFSGKTLNDGNEEKEGVREYSGTVDLGCDCCKITCVEAKMKHGVLRMIVSRVKAKNQQNKCTLTLPPFTGKSGRHLEDHPFVVKGRKGAFGGETTAEGGLYFAVDVPDACSDDVDVFVGENEVRFLAEIKNLCEHDEIEGGRVYLGSLRSHSSASSLLSHNINWDAEFGVLKIFIGPLHNAPTTTN